MLPMFFGKILVIIRELAANASIQCRLAAETLLMIKNHCRTSTPSRSFGQPRRVSLRTRLIATTLIAVGLGLIVWLGR